MMAVIGILSITLALGAGALRGADRAQRGRAAADRFLQSLREAREAAKRHGWRTRVVLSISDLPPAAGPHERQPPENAYAIFTFRAPMDAAQFPILIAPARSVEGREGLTSTLTEWVAGGPGPLLSTFIGQWTPLPEAPLWIKLPDGVQMDGALLEEYAALGHEAFASRHFFKPLAVWNPAGGRARTGYSNRSPYPESYDKTPFPRSYPLVIMPVPIDEQVYDASRGASVGAREIWGDQPLPQFVPGADPEIQLFALPAIEFGPDGALASKQREPLTVRFHPAVSPQPAYEVAIDPAAGQATLQVP